MILLRAMAVFCVGTAAKMETRGQLRAKWTDFQTCLQRRTIKGTALFSYYASALQGAKFIVLRGSSVCPKKK